MKKILFILLLSLLFPTTTFIGKIINKDLNPIYNSNIELLNTRFNSISDKDGIFLFSGLENGRYTLKITHVAYEDSIISIEIPNQNDILIIMNEKSIDIDRVVVTGTRYERHIKDTPVLTHMIGNRNIKNTPSSSVKEALEIAMPNVQNVASNHSSDRLKIQGLDNKYILFLINGERISGEFAGNLDFNMLNLYNVEKIEIVEGAMSVLYGSNSIGGVVNIITSKQKNPQWFNVNYIHDDPIVNSRALNLGFNSNKLYYNFIYVQNFSDGYDLTPYGSDFFSKTLEEYYNQSIEHQFSYELNTYSSIDFLHKDYFSNINKYEKFAYMCPNCPIVFNETIVYEEPLPRYYDKAYGVKYRWNRGVNNLKISYNYEVYKKKNFYFDYHNYLQPTMDEYLNPNMYIGSEFLQGKFEVRNFLIQSTTLFDNHYMVLGFEDYDNWYSSYNIYVHTGDLDNNGICDQFGPLYDCEMHSIFDSKNGTKSFKSSSLFLYDQWSLQSGNTFAIGLRYHVYSNESKRNLISSLSYVINRGKDSNIKFNYSNGFRNPSLKELYYEWIDHDPKIYGNPNLNSTTNNYFSMSFDKRTYINDFSWTLYHNEIKNMIYTEYALDGLLYKNEANKVTISGENFNYSRKIDKYKEMSFVYNYTFPITMNNEILELISKHSLRISYLQTINEELKVIINVKYSGEKFNFDQEEDWTSNLGVKKLDSYWITDIVFVFDDTNDFFKLKWGVKNIFDYKDPSRYNDSFSNVLNVYDPGRRYYIELGFNY